MPKGEKLFKFLASLMLRGLYGTVTIRFASSAVTHVQAETRRMWQYRHLPEQGPVPFRAGRDSQIAGARIRDCRVGYGCALLRGELQ